MKIMDHLQNVCWTCPKHVIHFCKIPIEDFRGFSTIFDDFRRFRDFSCSEWFLSASKQIMLQIVLKCVHFAGIRIHLVIFGLVFVKSVI